MSLQNEPLTPAEGYAETAYRAEAIPEQSYAPKNERLSGRILETRLPWGSYLGVNPTIYQYSESWFREYQYIGDDYHDYTMINESRWSQRIDENVNDFYRIARFFFVILSHGFSFKGGLVHFWCNGGVYYSFYICCRFFAASICSAGNCYSNLWYCDSLPPTLGKTFY